MVQRWVLCRYMRLHGDVATYTILYTYKVLIVCDDSTFLRCFCLFSVCRIHVTLDNFTIWCTAIVSTPKGSWPQGTIEML
jgi:hypothetical protein